MNIHEKKSDILNYTFAYDKMATSEQKIKAKGKTVVVEDDDDFDKLLNDTLEDFETPITKPSTESNSLPTMTKTELDTAPPQISDENFDEEDFAKQLAEGMEQLMTEMHSDESIKNSFEKIWQSMEQNTKEGSSGGESNSSSTLGEKDKSTKDFKDTIKQTLNKLGRSTEEIDGQMSDQSSDLFMEEMMKQMEALAENGEFQNVLEGMMEQLMSKELLYEPMKEMASKYPEYLEANATKLSKADYERYKKQYEYVQKIVARYEAPDFNDKDESQAKEIVDLMQQMQDCGQPPDGILGPEMQVDGNGLPNLPDGEQCIIM